MLLSTLGVQHPGLGCLQSAEVTTGGAARHSSAVCDCTIPGFCLLVSDRQRDGRVCMRTRGHHLKDFFLEDGDFGKEMKIISQQQETSQNCNHDSCSYNYTL